MSKANANKISKQKNVVEQVKNGQDVEFHDNKNEQKRVRKQLDENLLVRIASGVHGGLTYISRDGSVIKKFEQFGDEDVIELKHLRAMLSQARKFLQKGWIRVLDEEVIEYLNLERFQREVFTPDDLEELFAKNPEHIKEVIQSSNANTKRIIYNYAKEKYVNGELTNIHIIKAIEEGIGESLDPNR